jgi:hypothetical protein
MPRSRPEPVTRARSNTRCEASDSFVSLARLQTVSSFFRIAVDVLQQQCLHPDRDLTVVQMDDAANPWIGIEAVSRRHSWSERWCEATTAGRADGARTVQMEGIGLVYS